MLVTHLGLRCKSGLNVKDLLVLAHCLVGNVLLSDIVLQIVLNEIVQLGVIVLLNHIFIIFSFVDFVKTSLERGAVVRGVLQTTGRVDGAGGR